MSQLLFNLTSPPLINVKLHGLTPPWDGVRVGGGGNQGSREKIILYFCFFKLDILTPDILLMSLRSLAPSWKLLSIFKPMAWFGFGLTPSSSSSPTPEPPTWARWTNVRTGMKKRHRCFPLSYDLLHSRYSWGTSLCLPWNTGLEMEWGGRLPKQICSLTVKCTEELVSVSVGEVTELLPSNKRKCWSTPNKE